MPSSENVVRACSDIIDRAQLVRTDVDDLIRRTNVATRDGFPRSSGLSGGRRPARDTNGEALPDYSDPTGELAVEDDQADQVRADVLEMVRHVREAHHHLVEADRARQRALAPAVDNDGDVVVDLEAYRRGQPVCVNPHCEELAERKKAGRCGACHEYRRRTARDAGPAVITERIRQRQVQRERLAIDPVRHLGAVKHEAA